MQAKRETPALSVIGRDTPRVDGPVKVAGAAKYSADFQFPGMLYAVPVEATIANGRITRLEATTAEKMPGVRAVLHRGNIGRLYRSVIKPDFLGICDERRPPFADDVIRYYGQYVALAVADTFETAKAAADAVRVTYAAEKPNVDYDLEADDKPRVDSERGDPERALAGASVKFDQTYITPVHTHNPMELHATVAVWDGPQLTLHESTQ